MVLVDEADGIVKFKMLMYITYTMLLLNSLNSWF